MITTKIVFDHRGRTKKNVPGPLEIRVTVDRKPYYVQTGVRVLRNEWKYDSVVNRLDAQEMNERLVIMLRRVEQEINVCLEKGFPIDVADIRHKVTSAVGSSTGSTDFIDWCEGQIEKLIVVEGTKKHYRTLCSRLRDYGQMGGWGDVTTEAVLDFDSWLHQRKTVSTAGIYTYHKCLKSLLNRADAMGKIQRNPYDRLKGKIKRGDKENVEYLTEGEMLSICNLRFEDGTLLQRAKDLFVFQMYTGLAYSDAMNFSIDNYKNIGGKWISNQERVKTGVPFVNQLLPPVVEVLKRYGMSVPRLDQADYNHALKLIGQSAGIKIKMHSHLARHTFATFMLRNGVKIENLQKMLGHNSIVTTQRYAKVLAQAVHEDFEMIAEKIKKEAL